MQDLRTGSASGSVELEQIFLTLMRDAAAASAEEIRH